MTVRPDGTAAALFGRTELSAQEFALWLQLDHDNIVRTAYGKRALKLSRPRPAKEATR